MLARFREMHPIPPIVFEPLYMERVWGGRRLEGLLGKRLPPGERIGESWEIVDREDAQSVVHDGPFRGRTLHDLWSGEREAVFGAGLPDLPRFPLLFKLLDAQDRLSLQVHPPPGIAARLGGEAKTEVWHVLDAAPAAHVYAGLAAGVTRAEFQKALEEGRVEPLVQRIPTRAGQTLFIPSGRIHGIGPGNVIFEAQQNSDTTYRVFDWNRPGLDGRPRRLHVAESLQAIDFEDHTPAPLEPAGESLVDCDYFRVEKWALTGPRPAANGGFAVIFVLEGRVECGGREFVRGDFFLLPPGTGGRELIPRGGPASVLRTTVPRQERP